MQPIMTSRLILRPFSRDDEDAAFGFFGDRDVMRFSLNGPHLSRKPTEDFILTNINRQCRSGFSIWAVVEQSSGGVIGMCGLAEFSHGVPGIELAYRLRRDKWGQGYASEAAEGAVAHAFAALRLERLIGAVEPANVASVRVLEKSGFQRMSRQTIAGKDALLFEQTRSDWLSRQFQKSKVSRTRHH